jgi:predicted MFS family arabinose efflux permease
MLGHRAGVTFSRRAISLVARGSSSRSSKPVRAAPISAVTAPVGWRVPYLVAAALTLLMALVLARAVPVTVPRTRQRYRHCSTSPCSPGRPPT